MADYEADSAGSNADEATTRGQYADLLKARFSYDADTGLFTFKDCGPGYFASERAYKRFLRMHCGKQAGGINPGDGYVYIRVNGKSIPAHHVAWVLSTGSWPEDEIDHEDGDGSNNKLKNLREATRSQNMQNISLPKSNKSGVIGVSWKAKNRKWCAQISDNGKKVYLGLFDDLASASASRAAAERALSYHHNHGRAA